MYCVAMHQLHVTGSRVRAKQEGSFNGTPVAGRGLLLLFEGFGAVGAVVAVV